MAFTQDLFSSRRNYSDGNTRINQMGRIWYDSITHTLRIQLDDTPGGTIIGGGGTGGIALTDLSVATATANAGGSLSYNNTTGIFTYAPADLDGLASITYVNGLKDRIVSPNDLHATIIDNTGTTTSGGDILPGAATYNLGSVENPWKDIYVSQGSIVIADTNPAVDGVSISNTDKYIVIDQGGLKITSDIPGREIFQLDATGKLLLKSEIPVNTDSAAFEVIGSLLGESLPIVNRGVMIHSSGAVNVPSRIYVDGVGTQTTAPFQSAYAAFIGRYARNTVADPQPAQAGDIIVRFGGNAMADDVSLNTISNVRIDMTATETQSSTGRGSRIEFWTTPIGSAVPQRSVHFDSAGIDLSEATDINAGIVFKDGSLLKYWPDITGNAGKILRTDGATFFWATETVPDGQVLFKGDWSAAYPPSGGTPTISDATGEAGWQWIVSEAGTQDLGSGNITFAVGDLVIHNGTHYVKIDGTTPQVQSDWTETNTALPAYIKNKPTLATVATTGSWNDLLNKPTIPAAQVNSDWNATSGLSQILNKPTIPTQYTDTMARAAISLTSNTPSGTTSTLTYVNGLFTFTSAAALVSGTSIKTVNNNSLLGSGNVSVGTVTSVGGTGTVSGLTLTGTVTGSGNLTLGGTIDKTSSTVFGIAKVDGTTITANAGVISAVNSGGTNTVNARLTAVSYTATTSDYWIGCSAKNITITLPGTASNGRQYQIADCVHSGNPSQTIRAASPATASGNTSTSQQGQSVTATYINGVWYCN